MEDTTEFLILADGRLMVHNITPTMAAILSELNPNDELMRQRAHAIDSAQPVELKTPAKYSETLL